MFRRSGQERRGILGFRFQVLAFVLIGFVALVLFRSVYLSNFENVPQAVLVSADPTWLGASDELPAGFAVWENFERNILETSPVERLVVTQVDRNGRERVVHPFHLMLTNPNYFTTQAEKATRLPISQGERVCGYLYVHLDRRHLTFFDTLFWTLFALILIGAVAASMRFSFQEKSIESITSQLEQKKRQLADLEKLALVGQLTANVLHDLKKPLLNIRDEVSSLPESESKASIRRQVELFFEMVRDLNIEGFLSRESLRDEFIDLQDVIEQSLRLVRYEMGNVNASVRVSTDTPFILGVKHRLVQVFSNLILNSLEAMKGKGDLTIDCERYQDPKGLFARARISDTGKGIPQDVIGHVFEPFYTYGKSQQSTGLGLYITREIIEEMGGTISVESIVDQGTFFTILLPATLDQE
ncbi:MAG TPA: HAMP domain-containing sensor histidine kinase [bacterium]|nr:HAMP domain-containing sensor histidine kinase [bacterium]